MESRAVKKDSQREVLKLSAKGQLTLPKAIREALDVAEGDYLVAYGTNRFVVLEPLKETPFGRIAGEFASLARESKLTPSNLETLIRRARKRASLRQHA